MRKIFLKKKFLFVGICAFLLLILINLIVYKVISREKYIHYWDTSQYWISYKEIGYLIKEGKFDVAWEKVNYSLKYEAYNNSPVIPLIPFYLLAGGSREVYVGALTNIFAIPSLILILFFIAKVGFVKFKKRTSIILLTCFTAFLSPVFWIPIFEGRVSISGVLISTFILFIYFRKPFKMQKLPQLALIAFLMALLVLMRRWFVFWVIGFITVLGIFEMINIYIQNKFNMPVTRDFLYLFSRLLFLGVSALVTYYALAPNQTFGFLSAHWIKEYSAWTYKSDPIKNSLVQIKNDLGVLYVAFIIGGLTFSLKEIDKKRKLFIFFITSLTFLVLVFYISFAVFGISQYHFFIPFLVLLPCYFVFKLKEHIEKELYQKAFLLVYCVVIIVNFLLPFTKISENLSENKVLGTLFTKIKYHPERNDLDAIQRLIYTLDELEKKEDFKGIYVLASSEVINDDLLRNACRFYYNYDDDLCGLITYTANVDTRDYITEDFFKADLLVVAEPTQYHLDPIDQEVIGVPKEQIEENGYLSSYYEKLFYDFKLDKGVDVYLYKKVKDYDSELTTKIQSYPY